MKLRVLVLDTLVCDHIGSCLEHVTIEGRAAPLHAFVIQSLREAPVISGELADRIKELVTQEYRDQKPDSNQGEPDVTA